MAIRGRKLNPHNVGPQIGDVLPHPSDPGETFTVTGRSKRYVTGETSTGAQVGETGVGTFEQETIGRRKTS